MRAFKWQYPGDPVAESIEMTRAEFLAAYPREPLRFVLGGVVVAEKPLSADEIACDFCDDDPGDKCYILYGGLKAICPKCAAKTVLPYEIGRDGASSGESP